MFEYSLIQSENGENTVYGVRITDAGNEVRVYPEISENKAEAERFLQRIGSGDLSPLHFDDVARDYLLELAFERMDRNRIG